ncbi:MAG: hypothetical protein ABSG86_14205 [Thermoguttaceae bacterium]|jgi:hypothetical protein
MPVPPAAGFLEDFEGPNPSWMEAGGDAPHVLQAHRRVQGVAHRGRGCEWFQFSVGPGGSAVYIAHDLGCPWVIEDLRPSVWVKSDRPGLQLLVEVLLPRTINPRTGRAAVVHLWGSTYSDVGRWQQLSIDAIAQLLARQVRILRSQLATPVDAGEAYVGRVLLNVYGGPGVTNVWIDDLAAAGYVASGRAVPAAAAGLQERPAESRPMPADNFTARVAPPPEVQLAGSTLLVRGQPMLPRAIQYQGEPLSLLKQLGFNTVWLRDVPSAEFLAEAARLGLWVVCPPPLLSPPAAQAPAAAAADMHPRLPLASQAIIGPEFQPVLAWDLGSGLTTAQLEANRRWAEAVRLADVRGRRPLVACPASDLREYSRHVNLLLIDRRVLGTSLDMSDYGVWVRREPLLARPGTPVWTTIQTQPGEGLRRQLAALAPGWATPTAFAPEQIRLLVWMAVSCGSRGLVFQSQSPLGADDPQTRQRALTLQLLNFELELMEPWVAAGSFEAVAQSSRKEVTGGVLRSHRARLVLPAWLAPHSQCVAPEATARSLALLVPGIPESCNAYELTAGRLEPLRHKRDTGGTCVTLDEFHLTGMVLLVQDPTVWDAVNRRAAANGRAIAEIERQLAGWKLQAVGPLVASLTGRLPPATNVAGSLAESRRALDESDARLRAGDFQAGWMAARRATRPLRALEWDAWNAAMTGLPSPVLSPGTAAFATLPWHWNLVDRLRGSQAGPNRLPGGDFEDVSLMLRAGWRHGRHAVPGVTTAADLVPEARHSGRWGMRLTARADDPENPPAMIETPPIWITTPAVPVQAGQIVWIHGWVYVPAPITGSVDGLMVIDSLGGEDLAERIDKTDGWGEFRLLRAVDRSGPLTVTFALSGLGEARLDDIAVQVMEPQRGP